MPAIPLFDSFAFKPIGKPVLTESAVAGGQMVLSCTGVFQNWKERNINRRTYPKPIWEALFKEGTDFMRRLKSRAMVGLLEHPEDGVTRYDRSPSHVITDVHFATDREISEAGLDEDGKPVLIEGDIIGTFEVLETHNGQDLAALIKAKIPIGVSSRGGGTLLEDGDGFIVDGDFDCETWDVVQSPSVVRALPRAKIQMVAKPLGEAAPTNPPVPAPSNPPSPQLPIPPADPAAAPAIPAAASETDDSIPVTVPPALESAASNQPTERPSTPQTITESTIMSKLEEMKTLGLDITRLTSTSAKGLKPSERSAMFEAVTNLQVQVGKLVQEDASLAPVAAKHLKRLTEYEDELDSPDAPPVEPVPPVDEPAIDDEPIDGECGVDAATLLSAADKLRELGGEDEEAGQLADDLTAAADAMGDEGEGDLDDLPPDDDGGLPPENTFESRIRKTGKRLTPKKGKKVVMSEARARLIRKESQLRRLSQATSKLLERYNGLRKINSNRAKLGESASGRTAAQLEEAATDIAQRYNRDMIEWGFIHLRDKRPALLERHSKELNALKTWKEFTESVQTFIAEGDKLGKPPVAPRVPKAPVTPVIESTPVVVPQVPILTESSKHPAVGMVRRNRQ